MNLIIRGALALLAPALTCAQGPAQVASDVKSDPNFEARYCAFLSANRFEDNVANYRWAKIIAPLEEGRPETLLREISRDAFALAQQAGSEKAKADFERCNERLAVIEAQAQQAQTAAVPSNGRSPVTASSSARQIAEGRRAGRTVSSMGQATTRAASAEPSPMPPLPPGGSLFPPLPRLEMSESGVLREPPATRTGEDAFKCHASSVVPVTVCYNASFWLETKAPPEYEAVFKSPADRIQFALFTATRARTIDAMRETLLQRIEATASGGQYGMKIALDKTLTLDGHPWRYVEYSVNINGLMKHYVNVFTTIDGAGTVQIMFAPSDTDAYRPEIDEIISRIRMQGPRPLDLSGDPYYEARYCENIAARLGKENEVRLWSEIAGQRGLKRPENLARPQDVDPIAASGAGLRREDKARADYTHCAALLEKMPSSDASDRASPPAAGSYWKLPTAPRELAEYGFEYGIEILDDTQATFYLTEYRPFDNPVPPEVAVVALLKSGRDKAFVEVKTVPGVTDGGMKRRLAASEIERFNEIIAPAVARRDPTFARFSRVTTFYYAQGQHFAPTESFASKFRYRKPAYEQPLLELMWHRTAPDARFQPHAVMQNGVSASALPVTVAEATVLRSPVQVSAAASFERTSEPRHRFKINNGLVPKPIDKKPVPENKKKIYARPADSPVGLSSFPPTTLTSQESKPVSKPIGKRAKKIGTVQIKGFLDWRTYTWQQRDDGVKRSWRDAIIYCEQLVLGGYSDWQLPHTFNYEMITQPGNIPGIRTQKFPDIIGGSYWTRTTGDVRAWGKYIVFGSGRGLPNTGSKDARHLVLCFRSG